MILKGLIDEDFINYRKPAMVLEFPKCNFKCDKECGMQVCQNSRLANAPIISTTYASVYHRYIQNPITSAIVMQGLEPFDSVNDVIGFIQYVRKYEHCDDDIVIYTGYKEEELEMTLNAFKALNFKNIIIKFGRYIPNQESHYDKVLGVKLASENQYGKKIS